jgi:hypothetical protein
MSDFAAIRFQPQRPLLRELSADRLNTILTEIRRNKPKGERGITVRQSGDGTYIGLAAALPTGKGGTPTTTHPFQISSRQDPDNENQYLVTVRPGTINTLLPSGILSGGGLTENTIPKDQLRYVVLEASSDGQQITTASVSVESSAPSAQTPEIFGLPSSAKFLLGLVYNSNVFQVQFTNLVVAGKQQFIASKSSPAAAGELPYEIYYVWG